MVAIQGFVPPVSTSEHPLHRAVNLVTTGTAILPDAKVSTRLVARSVPGKMEFGNSTGIKLQVGAGKKIELS